MLNTAKKITFGLITVGLMTASADSYRVSLHQDAKVDGKEIKTGDYKIEVKNDTAVMKRGKETIEVPVRTETVASKFNNTQIQYNNNTIQEIRLGGTNTKLVFGGDKTTASGM